MSEAKLGLVIVLTFAVAAIFGSMIMYANGNSENRENILTGNLIAAPIADDSSLSNPTPRETTSSYALYAVNSYGNAILASTAESTLSCTWTTWLNRDLPDGTGDWETLADFTDVCKNPVSVDCKTTAGTDFRDGGQRVICTTSIGLTCKAADNPNGCSDYQVRFCCPKTITPVIMLPTACTDSDGGINYGTPGDVLGTLSLNGESIRIYDSCTSSRDLREMYCDSASGLIKNESYTCPAGCIYEKRACAPTNDTLVIVDPSVNLTMKENDTVNFNNKIVIMARIGTSAVVISVNNTLSTVNENITKTVNGIRVRVNRIYTEYNLITNATKGYAASITLMSQVQCYVNSDCGTATTTRYCSADSRSTCTSSTSYTCNNPGTVNATCSGGGGGGCTACPNGCNNISGECKISQERICTDSDGGDYPYTTGNVSLQNPDTQTTPYMADICYYKPTVTYSASCNGTGCQIMENYCIDTNGDKVNDLYNSHYVDCPNGCSNGACITTTTTCTNECMSGVKQCSGSNNYQTCGNYDTDSCYEWSTTTTCAAGQTCNNGACIDASPNYVPFTIGIGNTAPSSDVLIATELYGVLVSNNLASSQTTGVAKLFSEINGLDLDNKVTLAIYKGTAVIIVGDHSPSSYVTFASDVSYILYKYRNITVKTILSSEVQSADLLELFVPPVPCVDYDRSQDFKLSYINIANINPTTQPSFFEKSNGTGIYSGSTAGNNNIFGLEPDVLVSKPSPYKFTIYIDHCASETQLNEAFCSNGKLEAIGIPCPNGCLNGVCLEKPIINETCIDSDGGLNYNTKGTVNATNSATPKTDYCVPTNYSSSQTTLGEYYCAGLIGTVQYYNCPTGTVCSDGACVLSPVKPVYETKTVFLNVGASTEFVGKNVILYKLSTASAVITVNGIMSVAYQNKTKLVNGVIVTLEDIAVKKTCGKNRFGSKCTTTPYAATIKLETPAII